MRSANDTFSGRAKCLAVLLPGRGDSAETFAEHGFVSALRSRSFAVDIVSANATMGYYYRGIVVDRLAADVLGPARGKGYEQTWLVGISMGGLGTFMVAKERGAEVQGLLALAPALGAEELAEEIRSAGGLLAWKAPEPAPMTEENYQRQIWRWLQAVVAGREPGPAIHLGYGEQDSFAPVDSVLAAALPPERVFRGPGAHDWPTWNRLFAEFLDRSEFAKACR